MKNFKKYLLIDYNIGEDIIDDFLEQIDDNNLTYSKCRSAFMRFVHSKVIEYDFMFHAGLVKFNGKLIVIVGDKGCGKTSSILYFLEHGATVYTDELVFIKDKRLHAIGRSLALEKKSIVDYFKWVKPYIWKTVKSDLNENTKFLLQMPLSNFNGESLVDEILILIPKNNHSVCLSKREIYSLLEKQLFINPKSDPKILVDFLSTKLKILDISELERLLINNEI